MFKKRFVLPVVFIVVLLSCLLVGCEEKECTHSNYKWVTTKEPTCTEPGLKEKRCVDCGELLDTVSISKKAHDFGDWIVDEQSTCAVNGSQHRECKVCGNSESLSLAKLDHTWGEWVVETEATCEEDGKQTRECTGCHTTETETIEATGCDWSEWVVETSGIRSRECSRCHYIMFSYEDPYHDWGNWEIVDAQLGTKRRECNVCHEVDETVAFGTYPQTQVKDETVISQLNSLLNGLPEAGVASINGWTSYNYYKDGKVAHFMWYQDVTYDGNKYRAVYFIEKRPVVSFSEANERYEKLQIKRDDELPANVVYWYKWEPLTWIVMGEDEESQLLICEKIIDAQMYLNISFETYSRTDLDCNVRKFATSDIYSWLQNEFISASFEQDEQDQLLPDEKRVMLEFDSAPYPIDQGEYLIRIPTCIEAYSVCSFEQDTITKPGEEYYSFYYVETDYAICQGAGTFEGLMTMDGGVTGVFDIRISAKDSEFDMETFVVYSVLPVIRISK